MDPRAAARDSPLILNSFRFADTYLLYPRARKGRSFWSGMLKISGQAYYLYERHPVTPPTCSIGSQFPGGLGDFNYF